MVTVSKESNRENTKEQESTKKRESIEGRVKILEFQEKYAESLADMWNASNEEWGGQDGNRTAEQIKSGIRNEGNIKDFVALDGETVIGYCSFKEYEDDEGASYIPLLNVRPKYHGKKIGKKLLLKALEVAVEEGWPRMDLYTWSSNLKAVPLYKKCGFFWEMDNPYIHLMNFMPTVLNTEAITAYFQDLDWYADVARDLSVEPDGRVENGFHFYEYRWENGKDSLRAEFCRRGRGLRLIENKDYKVVCYTENNEFAFGKSYPVFYRIINKTDRPLTVKLKGRDDKNLRFSYENTVQVKKEKTLKASFYPEAIKELYKKDLTHPAITTDLEINGKKAEFRLGIVPKFPLDIRFQIPHKESFAGKTEKGVIDLENGFDQEIKVSFELQDSPELQWEEKRVFINLKGKEKTSLPVKFRVRKPGFYHKNIEVDIQLPEEKMTLQKEIKTFLRGRRGKSCGETEEGWSVVNGAYKLTLTKHENHIKIEDLEMPSRDEITYPKLGLPFGTDFSNKLPKEVGYETEEDLIRLRAVFDSKDFSGIKLHSLSELFSDGTVKQFYEVENTGEEDFEGDIRVSASLWHKFPHATFCYDHEIIELEGMEESRLVYYDIRKFTENWSYAKVGENSWGVVWPKGVTPEREGPFIKINENLGSIPKGGKRTTKPVFMLYNTMRDWQELRRFALEDEDSEGREKALLKPPVKTFEVRVNEKNPFVKKSLPVQVLERKATYLSGTITLESHKGMLKSLKKTYEEEEALGEDSFVAKLKGDEEDKVLQEGLSAEAAMDTIRITADLKKTRRVYNRQVFLQGDAPIEKTKNPSKLQKQELRRDQVTEDGNLYRINNGLIRYSADPDYSNGLCSLTVAGKEMLDSSYPKYDSKFPWNPWAGGTYGVPKDYELESMLQQKRRGEFTERVDSKGNRWEGIKVSTGMDRIEKFKGLTIHQYFLTLPGIPVVTMFYEIQQETGKYLGNLELENMLFIRPDPDLSNTYFAKRKASGEKVEFKAGKYFVAHNAQEKLLEVGSRIAPEKVLIYAPKAEHLVGFTNKDMLVTSVYEKTSAKNKTTKALDPVFLIFTKDSIELEALEDLQGIWF